MKVGNEVRDELTYLVVWHHRLPMRDDEDGDLLLAWLLGHYRRTIPQRMRTAFATVDRFEWWPDLCYICGADYGLTMSGRIRHGCPKCKREGSGELFYGWRRYSGLDLDTPEFFNLALKYRRTSNGP